MRRRAADVNPLIHLQFRLRSRKTEI